MKYLGPLIETDTRWVWRGPGTLAFSLDRVESGFEEYHYFRIDFVPTCCPIETTWAASDLIRDSEGNEHHVTWCGQCREEVQKGQALPLYLYTPAVMAANAAWKRAVTQRQHYDAAAMRAHLLIWLDHDHPLQAELIVDDLAEELDTRFNELLGDTVARFAGVLTGDPSF